jgi:hypothetical protein
MNALLAGSVLANGQAKPKADVETGGATSREAKPAKTAKTAAKPNRP